MKFKTDVTIVFHNGPRKRGVLSWEADLKQESWGITDLAPKVKSEGVLSVIEGMDEAVYEATEETVHEIKPCPVPAKMIGLTPTLVEIGKDDKIKKIHYVGNAA